MAARLIFDNQHQIQPFTIILSKKNLVHIGQLSNIEQSSISYEANLNSADELSFNLYKEVDGIVDPLWDEVKNFMLIWVKELNEYFELHYDLDQTQSVVKHITCVSLCEAELSQIMLYGLEINTQEDMNDYWELNPYADYTVVKFYVPNKEESEYGSLLDIVLDKAPHYTIGHVDKSLMNLQRTFSINGTSIYDFLTGDCAEQFGCMFEFDTTTRTINVYDIWSTCLNDGGAEPDGYLDPEVGHVCPWYDEHRTRYRGVFNDTCPKCGSKLISFYGKDTTVYVDKDNLTDEMNFSTDVDSIKNSFRLEAGDDYLTDVVKQCNPNGSQYIYYFSPEMKSMMSNELVEAIEEYDEYYNSYLPEYEQLNEEIYSLEDVLQLLEYTMMPERTEEETNASIEAAKLTGSAMSPVALTSINSSTSKTSVETSVEKMASTIITPGRFKVEVYDSSYTSGDSYWQGNFKVINYSDPGTSGDSNDNGDIAYSSNITVQLTTNYTTYLQQRVKYITQNEAGKKNNICIADVLANPFSTDYATFQNALTLYSLSRLKSFKNAIDSGLEVLQQTGQGREDALCYDSLYMPLHKKLIMVEQEVDVRQSQVDEVREQLGYYIVDNDGNYTNVYNDESSLKAQRRSIQNRLNFQKWLNDKGEGLYDEFCSFRREDTYTNSNFISDLAYETDDNALLLQEAREFIAYAKEEIIKSGTAQHSISTNLYNLLVLPEFEPILNDFELGNFIRVRIEDRIYRLRLVHYKIDFNDLSRLDTEFSDMTQTANGLNDIHSILENAQTMATSYSSVERQSTAGQNAKEEIDSFREYGLNSALYKIKNADTEEVLIDNHGLLGREYDDVTDSYGDMQVKLTHNMLAFTDDNWENVSAAIGLMKYMDYSESINGVEKESYGVNANFLIGGYIQGSDIVGTRFYGYNPNTQQRNNFSIDEYGNIVSASLRNYSGTFSLDAEGNINGANISGSTIIGSTIKNNSGSFYVDSNGNITGANITGTNITGGNIYGTDISSGTLTGTTISGGSIKIGNNFNVDSSGNVISTNFVANDAIRIKAGSKYIYLSAYEVSRGLTLGITSSSSPTDFSYASADINVDVGTLYAAQIYKMENGNDNEVATEHWVDTQGYLSSSTWANRTTEKNINIGYGSAGYSSSFSFAGLSGSVSGRSGNVASVCYVEALAQAVANKKYLTSVPTVSWSSISGKPTIPSDTSDLDAYWGGSNNNLYFDNSRSDYYGARSGWVSGTFQKKSSSSDIRLKERIQTIDQSLLSSIYMELKPVQYYYHPDTFLGEDNKQHNGLIAQDIIAVLDKYGLDYRNITLINEERSDNEDFNRGIYKYINTPTYFEINYQELHAFHIQMIQKQQQEIRHLQQENVTLKGEIDIIKQRLQRGGL